ncbi:hypothetical protein B7463_g5659, partial [Scytalidium lignicola]
MISLKPICCYTALNILRRGRSQIPTTECKLLSNGDATLPDCISKSSPLLSAIFKQHLSTFVHIAAALLWSIEGEPRRISVEAKHDSVKWHRNMQDASAHIRNRNTCPIPEITCDSSLVHKFLALIFANGAFGNLTPAAQLKQLDIPCSHDQLSMPLTLEPCMDNVSVFGKSIKIPRSLKISQCHPLPHLTDDGSAVIVIKDDCDDQPPPRQLDCKSANHGCESDMPDPKYENFKKRPYEDFGED